MCYTKGDAQLWNTTYSVGKALNRKNVASQDFDPDGRRATNKAEYFGGSLYVTASGTYEPVVSPSLPNEPHPQDACWCPRGQGG